MHTLSPYPCPVEIRQGGRHSHAFARDPQVMDARYKESPPDHDRQKLLAASKDPYNHRLSTTPSSGHRSTSTQRDVHSAHEAMINDQMV